MKGFVPTPPHLVDVMVRKLFRARAPRAEDRLLDPGCGTGAFIEGVARWCREAGAPIPRLTGVDSDPALLAEARVRLGAISHVELHELDFLTAPLDPFDFVVGNPPYVPITGLSTDERAAYRKRYRTAVGRFDLYLLFFERALALLKPEGRLVFITPEKFLYVQSAAPLRDALGGFAVEEIEMVDESAFGALVTYPTITTVTRTSDPVATAIWFRDGSPRAVRLEGTGSWLPLLNGHTTRDGQHTLADAFTRISCGVATGADSVFVKKEQGIPPELLRFAFPTISGRELVAGEPVKTSRAMLIPYDRSGLLIPEPRLGPLGAYLREPKHYARLLGRTCVARKPWYAFHENPPLAELLRPKILCKDIGARPWFFADEAGEIVPRHSVYYLVPKRPDQLTELCAYLNSEEAAAWLMAHCQRAANGFFRLQSHVLKQLPLPTELNRSQQLAIV